MNYKNLSRRHVLRGMLNGGVVAVALPVLDCFLNDSGTAYANGAALPVRFGTWFWGLGGNNAILVPRRRARTTRSRSSSRRSSACARTST